MTKSDPCSSFTLISNGSTHGHLIDFWFMRSMRKRHTHAYSGFQLCSNFHSMTWNHTKFIRNRAYQTPSTLALLCMCYLVFGGNLNYSRHDVCRTYKKESLLYRSKVANCVSKDWYGASLLQDSQKFEYSC